MSDANPPYDPRQREDRSWPDHDPYNPQNSPARQDGYGQQAPPSGQYGPPSGGPGYGYGGPSAADGGATTPGWGYQPPLYGPQYAGGDQGQGQGYGQPAPSTWGGYGQPGPASYGQPGPASYRPNRAPDYGGPSDGYGQWGPPSQGAGQGSAPPRKSRKKLWVILGVIAAMLLVVVSGGGFLAYEAFAPAATIGGFCGYLKTQHYTDAYGQLSKQMQGQVTAAQFVTDAEMLDTAEGVVTGCTSTSYAHSIGAKTASATMAITRAQPSAQASALSGTMTLTNEGGNWKVQSLDTSLLGVNLGALKAVDTYCTAMRNAQYKDAYAVLGTAMTSNLKAADYALSGQLQDAIDGTVSSCKMSAVGSVNTDTEATVTMTLVRGKLGQRQGGVTLAVEGSAWKVRTIATTLNGTDVGGAVIGQRFCNDLSSGSYADAYTLLSENGKGGASVDDFTAIFNGNANGIKWTGCTLDLTTYTVSGASATVVATFSLQRVSDGKTVSVPAKLSFVKTGATWLLDDVTIQK